MKATPRPFKKARQESKHVKPKAVCTYCTGRSGLNLEKRKQQLTLNYIFKICSKIVFQSIAYVFTMAQSAIFLSLSTNLSMR